jgi:hypothetical protein
MAEPTTAEKRAYIDALENLSKRFDDLDHETVKRMVELLQQVRRNVGDLLVAGPSSLEQARLSQLRLNIDRIIRDFEVQYGRSLYNALNTADDIGALSVTEPLAALGLSGQFNTISPALLNISLDFSAELVKNIGDDMRREINRALRLAVLGQENPVLAMERVTNILGAKAEDGIWGTRNRPEVVRGVAARAEAIVRTEMTRMHNLGHDSQQRVLARNVPGLTKRWQATGDRRTRRSHLAAHRRTFNEPIPIDALFKVGNAKLRFPGDPRGPAKETIYCRCRVLTVHPEVGVIETPGDEAIEQETRERAKRKK